MVSRVFPEMLKSSKEFIAGHYEKALRETFRAMDKWLVSDAGIKALVEERYQSEWQ